MEIWYYCDSNQITHGPFDRAAFEELRRQGVLRASDLVWRDGWQQWQPSSTLPPLSVESFVQPLQPPQPAAQSTHVERVKAEPVVTRPAEQTIKNPQAILPGEKKQEFVPGDDGRVECSQCRLRVEVASTKILGGQVVCDRCQELMIKRLVTESSIDQPGLAGWRTLALRTLGVGVGLILLYWIVKVLWL